MAVSCFMSAGCQGELAHFGWKIEPEYMPVPVTGIAFPAEEAIAQRHAPLGRTRFHAQQRAEVKLLLAVLMAPGHGSPEQRPAPVVGCALIRAIDREEGRPGFPHPVVVRKEHVEGAEQLKLMATRAIVPF